MSVIKRNHHNISFIILMINISLFIGILSLVNFIQKNHKKWIKAVEQKVDDKVDEIKKEIPGIMRESIGGGFGF